MTKEQSAPPGGAVIVNGGPGDTEARAKARTVLRPTVGAAIAMQATYGKLIGDELLGIGELTDELADQCGKVNGGDLKRLEAMLVAQAHTLDAIFNRLALRASAQEYLNQYETYMRLALKAQGQARATVEALAELKNPRPVAFVRQANVGQNVQVVNGGAVPGAARAHGNVEVEQNEQLEAPSDGSERLVGGASVAAVRSDPSMATVDALDRADDGRR